MNTTQTKRAILKNFVANPHVGKYDIRRHVRELWSDAEEMPEGGIEGKDRNGKPTGVVFLDAKLRRFTAGNKEIILGPF